MKKYFIIITLVIFCMLPFSGISFAETLPNVGSISGIILNDLGEPIETALVKLDDGSKIMITNTNENGKYMFEDLYSGLYEIEAVKEGYISRQISGIMVNSDQNVVRNIVLQLQPVLNGSISGKVVNEADSLITGALVKIVSGPTIRSVISDDRGNYDLRDLKPGLYEIEISKSEYITKMLVDINLNSGEEKNNFNVILKLQSGFLSGKITNHMGMGIDSATITLTGNSYKTVATDSSGYYRFSDLKPGDYSVQIDKLGYITSNISKVTINAGKETADVNSTLLPIGGYISGSVFSSEGIAIKNAKISVLEGPTKGSTITDEFGFYTLKDLIPGTYTIEVSFEGYQSKKISNINVKSNMDSYNNDFYLIYSFGSISGTITQSLNKGALFNVKVEVIGQTTRTLSTTSTGSYKVENLDPGIYSIRVSKDGYISQQKFQIVVEEGKNQNIDFSLNTLGLIYGYIYDKSGRPVNNATVEIRNGNITVSSKTDSRGYYSLKDLIPGNYFISIYGSGYSVHETGSIEVTSDFETYIENIVLISTYGTISGRIVDEKTNKTVANSSIMIIGKTNKTIRSTTEGTFIVEGLELGTYSLVVTTNGYVTETIDNLRIEADVNLHQNIALTPRGSVSGKVEVAYSVSNTGYVYYSSMFAAYTNIEIIGVDNKSYTIPRSGESYNITDIDPGKYILRVSQDEKYHEILEIPIEIKPGENTVMNIKLDYLQEIKDEKYKEYF